MLAAQGGGSTSFFLPGVGQQLNGSWLFTHGDALGSVRAITGGTGDLLGTLHYSPFGERVASTGLLPFLGFTNEPQAPATDLTYLRARYYHPALGRFLTPDSIIPDPTNGQAWNEYTYVYNDVVNLTDPSGFAPAGLSGALHQAGAAIHHFSGWWRGQPDDCECEEDLRNSHARYFSDMGTALGLRLQHKWAWRSSPASIVATRVDEVYKLGWRTTTHWFWKHVPLVKSFPLVDWPASGWHEVPATSNPNLMIQRNGVRTHFPNFFKRSHLTNARMQLNIRGVKGLVGTIGISALIDVFAQGISDLGRRCLSPLQRAMRLLGAGAVGVVGATVTTMAFVGLTAAGVPTGAAVITTYLAGAVLSKTVVPKMQSHLYQSSPGLFGSPP